MYLALAQLLLVSFALSQQTCHDYVIISTRGTDEPQGPSVAFKDAINRTLARFPNGVEYDTVYPASGPGGVNNSVELGIEDIVLTIDDGTCQCPAQIYVLLGYSQGASVTAGALQQYTDEDSWGNQAIAAVLNVGNPVQRSNESAMVDQYDGASTQPFQGVLFAEKDAVPQSWYDSGKLKEVCYTGDLVCVGGQSGANWISHLQYGGNQGVQDIIARFIADRLTAEGLEGSRDTTPDLASTLVVDRARFPATQDLRFITSIIGGLGLRTPAGVQQNRLIDWLLEQLSFIPGIEMSVQESPILKWQTMDDQSLHQAASLSVILANGTEADLAIAGAVPWTRPTNGTAVTAELVYIPQGVSLEGIDLSNKIVIRDFGPTSNLNYPVVFFPQLYRSNDTDSLLNTSYNRPYTAAINADLINAGLSRAAGLISMFDVPDEDIESYFDPHEGTHYRLPGIYVGKETAGALRGIANTPARATMNVNAVVAEDTQRQITAKLSGKTNDTIYIVCHTDGNTYVQDNGVSALLALAHYFSGIGSDVREKTLSFVFTTGHLGYNSDSTNTLAAQLDATYDTDDTVLVIALEHMGTKELLPIGSPSGAANGNALAFSGAGELMVWCVGPSDELRNASISAAKKYDLDRVLITQGASIPNPAYAPMYASFGGIGTGFHQHLIPTTSIISGPWSLWAPALGADAIDFERLRSQTLAFAEVIVSVDPLSKQAIAGGYRDERLARANGTKLSLANTPAPPVFAPEPA